eukprot:gene23301-biopygen4311
MENVVSWKSTRSGSGAQRTPASGNSARAQRPLRTSRSVNRGGGREPLGRRWAGRAQGAAAGGSVLSWIPPWHAYLARFSRVRAAMRTAPGARKVGPDDTDELRE